MKKIFCELCGESDFLKVGGFFECQVCGAKYSVSDAKAMFVDVDANGNPIGGIATKNNDAAQKAPNSKEATPASTVKVDANGNVVKPAPTSIRRVVVQQKPATGGQTAVNKIVSTVKQSTQAREAAPQGQPVKRVVVKPVAVAQPKPVATQAKKPVAPAKPAGPKPSNLGVETNQLIQNFFILAQTAYDSQNFIDAENYANKVIEQDPTNCDAWLLKGNCAGWQTFTPTFRLLESINCWNTCLLNSSESEKEDYLFTVRTNCIEIAVAYVMRNIQDFKKNPSDDSIAKIKEQIDFVEPMMKKANQTFGVDVIVYEDKLASNISALVTEVSKAATAKFGKRKETQTDEAFTQFIQTQDFCIEVWDYLMDLSKKHGTVTAILNSMVKMHETIIRSCGYKMQGNKLKESMKVSLAERNQRLEKIQKAKKKLEDKFVDIRKRDRVDQKFKNAKYWEEHEEEKQALLDERMQLDHQIFELENSKLKMPILTELKKLEEECIRLSVLKDNPTYTGKQRGEFMDQLNKTRKTIVSKKREIASIIDPIDNKIEKMKRRMVNIDAELNMNR